MSFWPKIKAKKALGPFIQDEEGWAGHPDCTFSEYLPPNTKNKKHAETGLVGLCPKSWGIYDALVESISTDVEKLYVFDR